MRLPFSQVISSVVNCKIGLGCGGFAAIKMLLSLFLLCITLTCILWHILVYFHRNSCQASITNGQKIRACNSKSYYSSSPQLRYPQLRYFCSYAILNWVKKTQVNLCSSFYPQLRYPLCFRGKKV